MEGTGGTSDEADVQEVFKNMKAPYSELRDGLVEKPTTQTMSIELPDGMWDTFDAAPPPTAITISPGPLRGNPGGR